MHSSLQEQTWLDRALPLIRRQRKQGPLQNYGSDRVFALYSDRLVLAHVVRVYILGEEVYSKEGYKKLCWIAKTNHRVILYEDIKQLALTSASRGQVHFVVSVSTEQIRFSLPQLETPHVLYALRLVLGERFHVGIPEAEWMHPHFVRPSPKRRSAAKIRTVEKPFRSVELGYFIMFIGWLSLAAPLWVPAWLSSLLDWQLRILLYPASFGLCFLSALLFRWGRRLRLPSFEDTIRKDPRPPILYLRSFDDDSLKNLLLYPNQQPIPSVLGTSLLTSVVSLLTIVHMLGNIYRVLQGLDSQRNEDHLANALGDIGPLVAVGKPGEAIMTTGAARVYVSDDTWQAFILNLMQKVRIVLLQIAPTQGTWWEFQQCRQQVDPQKLVLLLTAARNSQQRYEEMRLQSWEMLPLPLPPALADFVVFDATWKPSAHQWEYNCTLWNLLLHGPSIDIKASLAPIIAQTGSRRDYLPPIS